MVSKKDMVEKQLKSRGISDPRVLEAMEEVDRSLFVPSDKAEMAYEDGPLPIGKNQTISQPYMVALMAEALELNSEQKVLEVGTGCGYNAAVLSRLVARVFSVEIVQSLAQLALEKLRTNYKNVEIRHGDGYAGWPEESPFDAIVLTAAPPQIPKPLKEQLKIGGSLVAPVGRLDQKLVVLKRNSEEEFQEKTLLPVRFVPMTGRADKGGAYGKNS